MVIEFQNGASINVSTSGSLNAVGTADKPIIFRGSTDAKGVWKGIFFQSNNVNNELTYCTVKNGGSASFDGKSIQANIRIAVTGKLKLTHSTISQSAGNGVYAEGLDDFELELLTSVVSDTFTSNNGYPLSLTAASVKNITTGILIGLNQYDKIEVRGGRMYGDHTWNKMPVPYYISGLTSAGYYTSTGNLTVQPGTSILCAADQGIQVGEYSNGYIKMVGTASEHILISGDTQAPGAWKGICFQSQNVSNQLSYVDVSYGGSSSFTGASTQLGNIVAGGYSAGSVTLTNVTSSNSAGYGVYATMASPVVNIQGVTFAGNASGTYYHE
jgi:hypothetical protein